MRNLLLFLLVSSFPLSLANDAWNKPNKQIGGVSRESRVNEHNRNWGGNPRGNSGWIKNDTPNKEQVRNRTCSRCGASLGATSSTCSRCADQNRKKNKKSAY